MNLFGNTGRTRVGRVDFETVRGTPTQRSKQSVQRCLRLCYSRSWERSRRRTTSVRNVGPNEQRPRLTYERPSSGWDRSTGRDLRVTIPGHLSPSFGWSANATGSLGGSAGLGHVRLPLSLGQRSERHSTPRRRRFSRSMRFWSRVTP